MRVRISIIASTFLVVLLCNSLATAQAPPPLDGKGRVQLPARPGNVADDPKGPVGSLSGRTSSDLLTLGSVWQVQECCGWSGTWTRRAGTNTFDAKWRHTNGSQAQDVITLQSWNKATGEVVLKRQNLNGTYKAILNPSARTLTNGTASWYPAGEKWSARY